MSSAASAVITEPPHVAIVTANPVPTGGMQTFTRALVRWLCDAGWRVTVACSGHDIYSAAVHGSADLRVRPVDWVDETVAGDRQYRLGVILKRRAWFRAVAPDLAVFVQSSNTPFRASVVGARLAGVPVVMTHRTLPWPIETVPPGRHLLGLVPGLGLHGRLLVLKTRFTAWLSSRVICNADAVADAYAAIYGYPRGRLAVIRNAVGQPANLPARRDARSDTGLFRVGYVGRLGAEKGVDLLLSAVAQVPPDVRIELYIAGDGPEREALGDLAGRLGLSDVLWHGHVNNPRPVYEQLDLLVMPSRRESSSNTVLEVMCAGIPVVVSDAGGLPELVDHGACGIIISDGDVSALAATLHRLARDRNLRDQLASAARARVWLHHHPRQVADAWLTLFCDVMGRDYSPQRAGPRSTAPPSVAMTAHQYEEVGV